MESLDFFNQSLFKIFEESSNLFAPIILFGQILGAMGSLFLGAKIAWSIYYSDQKFMLSQVYKILAVAICLLLYNKIIYSFAYTIEAFSEGIASVINPSLSNQQTSIMEVLSWTPNEQIIKQKKHNRQQTGTDTSPIKDMSNANLDAQILDLVSKHTPSKAPIFMNEVSESITGTVRSTNTSTNIIVLTVMQLLSQGILTSIFVLRTLILTTLYLLGPIVLGVYLIPIFNGALTAWIQKFVSISMWLPIAYIFQLLLLQVYDRILINTSLSDYTIQILFRTFVIIGFFSIPSLSHWLFTKILQIKNTF